MNGREPSLRRSIARGLRLRCPRCGRRALFEGAFRMREACPKCGLRFEREAGYFVGAIYLNYAFTVGIAVGGGFLLEWLLSPPLSRQLLLWGGFALLGPLLFFRHSRSLWLSFDHYLGAKTAPRPRAVRSGDSP